MKEKPSCKNGFHSVALSGLNNIFQVLWVLFTVRSVRDGADQDPSAQTRRFEGGWPCYWHTYRNSDDFIM